MPRSRGHSQSQKWMKCWQSYSLLLVTATERQGIGNSCLPGNPTKVFPSRAGHSWKTNRTETLPAFYALGKNSASRQAFVFVVKKEKRKSHVSITLNVFSGDLKKKNLRKDVKELDYSSILFIMLVKIVAWINKFLFADIQANQPTSVTETQPGWLEGSPRETVLLRSSPLELGQWILRVDGTVTWIQQLEPWFVSYQ